MKRYNKNQALQSSEQKGKENFRSTSYYEQFDDKTFIIIAGNRQYWGKKKGMCIGGWSLDYYPPLSPWMIRPDNTWLLVTAMHCNVLLCSDTGHNPLHSHMTWDLQLVFLNFFSCAAFNFDSSCSWHGHCNCLILMLYFTCHGLLVAIVAKFWYLLLYCNIREHKMLYKSLLSCSQCLTVSPPPPTLLHT